VSGTSPSSTSACIAHHWRYCDTQYCQATSGKHGRADRQFLTTTCLPTHCMCVVLHNMIVCTSARAAVTLTFTMQLHGEARHSTACYGIAHLQNLEVPLQCCIGDLSAAEGLRVALLIHTVYTECVDRCYCCSHLAGSKTTAHHGTQLVNTARVSVLVQYRGVWAPLITSKK
jgi:hypothetical protein